MGGIRIARPDGLCDDAASAQTFEAVAEFYEDGIDPEESKTEAPSASLERQEYSHMPGFLDFQKMLIRKTIFGRIKHR